MWMISCVVWPNSWVRGSTPKPPEPMRPPCCRQSTQQCPKVRWAIFAHSCPQGSHRCSRTEFRLPHGSDPVLLGLDSQRCTLSAPLGVGVALFDPVVDCVSRACNDS